MSKFEQFYEVKPWRVNQVWGVLNPVYAQFGFLRHNGTDVAIGSNKMVFAPFHGEVTKIGNQPGGAGLYICILSKNQYDWEDGEKAWIEKTYMHLEKTIAKVGDVVQPGDILAVPDNTGFSTGPHTHIASKRVRKTLAGYFEVDVNDAKGTFDDSSFYNGKFSVDERINLIKQAIDLFRKLLPFVK